MTETASQRTKSNRDYSNSTTKNYQVTDKQILMSDTKTLSDKIYDMIDSYCIENDHLFNRETKSILFTEHDLYDDKPVVCNLYVNVFIKAQRVFVKASNHRKRITIDLGFACRFDDYMRSVFTKNQGKELYEHKQGKL
jgi:hypothetical protein